MGAVPPLEPKLEIETGAATADGVSSSGTGASLVIASPKRTRYLGYRDLAFGTVATLGASTTLNVSGHITWIDRELRAHRVTAKEDELGTIALPLDDRHVLFAASGDNPLGSNGLLPTKMVIRDVVTQTDVTIGSYAEYTGLNYDAASHVVVITTDTRADRFSVDLVTGTVVKLRSLAIRSGATVHPRDPTLANGVIAVAVANDEDGTSIETFKDPGPGKQPIRATTSVTVDPEVLVVDRAGSAYLERMPDGETDHQLVAYRDGMPSVIVGLDVAAAGGDVSRDGTSIVLAAGNEIVLIDAAKRTIRWRFTVWQAHNVVFTGDDRGVIVASQGGLLELDTLTGRPIASGCGWGFGEFDEAPYGGTFGTLTVCEAETP